MVCEQNHIQRLKSGKSKIINCSEVKEEILNLFNSNLNEDKVEKTVYDLSRIWRIGEGIDILKKSLNMDHHQYYSRTSDPNNVEMRNILAESLNLSKFHKQIWNKKVCIL